MAGAPAGASGFSGQSVPDDGQVEADNQLAEKVEKTIRTLQKRLRDVNRTI